MVPPNALPPPAYFTIRFGPAWLMLVHGRPLMIPMPTPVNFGHQVNIEPLRPVCVAHAPLRNAWNAAVFTPLRIVPAGGVVRVMSGPVILKLVASCSTWGAYFTSTARRYGGNGAENAPTGITKPPPLPIAVPLPSVTRFFPAACFTQSRSRPVPLKLVVTAICGCVFAPRMIMCTPGVTVLPTPGPLMMVNGAHGVFPTTGILMIFPRFEVNFPVKP